MPRLVGDALGEERGDFVAGEAEAFLRTVEYYEPTEATLHERDDGLKVGAVKSETVKSCQPDCDAPAPQASGCPNERSE